MEIEGRSSRKAVIADSRNFGLREAKRGIADEPFPGFRYHDAAPLTLRHLHSQVE
ncbi:MAG: hypothetical protein FD152_4456 [Xanthobacteraceae bacterium]|nr:MAG: hypothetical protein FD152_4456 [Xanthobacteraceae bacterium]